MKKGFTLVEVSILFVIFLIVAFLVVPLSLDDNVQAGNISNWRRVQSEFVSIFDTINTQKDTEDFNFKESFDSVISYQIKDDAEPYKITFMNGTFPSATYRFKDFKQTQQNSIMSVKMFNNPQNDLQGIFMYDVNGKKGPNVWGKDVFGFNIYSDRFEPFCNNDSISRQKQDCSKNGTGLCCSSYYLKGGSLD